MSKLVRLYPQAWRDRYEAEFRVLLEERPPTALDVFDTIRGAVDAHLHPHLAGGEVEPSPWTHRIPGLLALAGGAMWSGWILWVAFLVSPDAEWGSLIVWSVLLMFLSLPGDYMAAHGRRIAVGFGVVGACALIPQFVPWELAVLASGVGYFVALGGMLTLAAIRAGVGSTGRWILLAVALGLPLAIIIPAALGFVSNERQLFTIMLPYGLAWILVGLRLTVRGSATVVDEPMPSVGSEVQPS